MAMNEQVHYHVSMTDPTTGWIASEPSMRNRTKLALNRAWSQQSCPDQDARTIIDSHGQDFHPLSWRTTFLRPHQKNVLLLVAKVKKITGSVGQFKIQGTRQLSGKRRYVGQKKIFIFRENGSVGRVETEIFLVWPNFCSLPGHLPGPDSAGSRVRVRARPGSRAHNCHYHWPTPPLFRQAVNACGM